MSEQATTTDQESTVSVDANDFYPANDSENSESTSDQATSGEESEKPADDESGSESTDEAGSESKEGESDKGQESDEGKSTDAFELKLSENTTLDDKHVEDLTAFAKEKGLSQEVAQEILSREEKAVSSYIESAEAESNKMVEDWRKEVENDKELGGDNLKETVAAARGALKEFGSEDLVKLLDESGYGNHPLVIKFLKNTYDKISDDSLVQPGAGGTKTKSLAETFYPNQTKE